MKGIGWGRKAKRIFPENYPKNEIVDRMRQLGYHTVEEFSKNSEVSNWVSATPVRKLIIHEEKISEMFFIKILDCLKFSPNDIKRLAIQWGYTGIVHLLGESDTANPLSPELQSILNLYSNITSRNPALKNTIIVFLETLCASLNMDCYNDLYNLKKNA